MIKIGWKPGKGYIRIKNPRILMKANGRLRELIIHSQDGRQAQRLLFDLGRGSSHISGGCLHSIAEKNNVAFSPPLCFHEGEEERQIRGRRESKTETE